MEIGSIRKPLKLIVSRGWIFNDSWIERAPTFALAQAMTEPLGQ